MGLFDLVEQRRQRIPLIACLLYESCYHFSFIFSFSYTTTTIFLFRFIAILFFFFLLPFVFFYFSIFFFFFFLCFILFFFCFGFFMVYKEKEIDNLIPITHAFLFFHSYVIRFCIVRVFFIRGPLRASGEMMLTLWNSFFVD